MGLLPSTMPPPSISPPWLPTPTALLCPLTSPLLLLPVLTTWPLTVLLLMLTSPLLLLPVLTILPPRLLSDTREPTSQEKYIYSEFCSSNPTQTKSNTRLPPI